MTIDEAESKQEEVDAIILINIKKFYKGREKIIEGFKNAIFLIYRDEEEEPDSKKKKNIRNENGLINYRRLARLIYLKHRGINDELGITF